MYLKNHEEREFSLCQKDLNVIREGYSIPSNIILSAPAAHETPRDNRPGHLCLNEHMLGLKVRNPFDFGVAEALWAFNVPPACIVPHSWKVIQTMAWYCERRGCSAVRYLWSELLMRRSSQVYVEFLARRDIKGIDNPPDSMPGWELRFFFAWMTSEVDIWGVLQRWEEPLLDPIPRSRLIVAQLKEELEASYAEVARLQSMLRRDVVRPSVVAEYLRSDAYHCRVEFE
ncbi:hypothetical protein ACLOJK_036625 [Asimina triloba]